MNAPVRRPTLRRTPARPAPPLPRVSRVLGLAALLLGAANAPVLAQGAVSPAQSIFDSANALIGTEYGGLSTVDRAGLARDYQDRLNNVCAPDPSGCPEAKAYPVLEAELTALGDEHSFFQTPEDYQDFRASMSGGNRLQFGVKLAQLDGQNRVITEVVPGSAAEEAGLKRGDALMTLNGQPYVYENLRRAREAGDTITLGVQRLTQRLTVTVTARESSTRDLPRLSFVPAAAGPGEVAVLRIPTFLSGGGVAQAVHDLVGQAQARGATGMVVDLRGNPGGSLAECDSAVSAFVPNLTRLARGADGNSRTVVSRGTRLEDGHLAGSVRSPNLWTGPLSVLVDEASASCSEFFAFEIKYAQRGPIVGEQTAGVGNTATRLFPVGDGALQLTILNYAKPDGTPYPTSVTPDQLRAQGENAVRELTLGKDDLLQAGLEALNTAPTLSLDPFRLRR